MEVKTYLSIDFGFPGGACGKGYTCQSGDARDMLCPLGCEDSLEEDMTTHSNIIAGEFQGQRSLAGYGP